MRKWWERQPGESVGSVHWGWDGPDDAPGSETSLQQLRDMVAAADILDRLQRTELDFLRKLGLAND